MRLWSKQLIEFIPNKQLVAQWREIIAIIGSIKKKGYPNHILVNKIMDYPLNHLSSYAKLIIDEMNRRGYKVKEERISYVYTFCGQPNINFSKIYPNWHNEEYIKICLYNIYEKYICGGVPEKEWNVIKNNFKQFLNN